MRTLLLAVTAALSLAAATAAQAGPLVVVAPATARVVPVAFGCGLGFHRGPYGGCIGNRAVVVAPRVFPRYVVRCGPHWTAFGWRRGCRY